MAGQNRMSFPFDDVKDAIVTFEKRFKDKTHVDWKMRGETDEYQGEYKMADIDSNNELFVGENQKDPFDEANQILIDICYEINIKSKFDENYKDFCTQQTNILVNLLPNVFKKNLILDSNDSIIKANIALNEYRKVQEESEELEE